MSDGPHRSLPMRRPWKKAAERAHNQAFSVEERRDAMVDAVRKEMPRSFIDSIRRKLAQMTLFNEDPARLLESIRPSASGSVTCNSLLDFLSCAMDGRRPGEAALRSALEDALQDRAACGMRQVEEHYIRRSGEENALNVRRRMKEALQLIDFRMIASQLLDPHSQPARRVRRRDGLNDGVLLC